MNARKGPFNPKILLWWVAVTALGISGSVFFLLKDQAEYDDHIAGIRVFVPVVGVLIAGICLIAGTAERWFYPK